jgi:hypothetical protein
MLAPHSARRKGATATALQPLLSSRYHGERKFTLAARIQWIQLPVSAEFTITLWAGISACAAVGTRTPEIRDCWSWT